MASRAPGLGTWSPGWKPCPGGNATERPREQFLETKKPPAPLYLRGTPARPRLPCCPTRRVDADPSPASGSRADLLHVSGCLLGPSLFLGGDGCVRARYRGPPRREKRAGQAGWQEVEWVVAWRLSAQRRRATEGGGSGTPRPDEPAPERPFSLTQEEDGLSVLPCCSGAGTSSSFCSRSKF